MRRDEWHAPFGPSDVRVIFDSCLQASMFFKTASSSPLRCLCPSFSMDCTESQPSATASHAGAWQSLARAAGCSHTCRPYGRPLDIVATTLLAKVNSLWKNDQKLAETVEALYPARTIVDRSSESRDRRASGRDTRSHDRSSAFLPDISYFHT